MSFAPSTPEKRSKSTQAPTTPEKPVSSPGLTATSPKTVFPLSGQPLQAGLRVMPNNEPVALIGLHV